MLVACYDRLCNFAINYLLQAKISLGQNQNRKQINTKCESGGPPIICLPLEIFSSIYISITFFSLRVEVFTVALNMKKLVDIKPPEKSREH